MTDKPTPTPTTGQQFLGVAVILVLALVASYFAGALVHFSVIYAERVARHFMVGWRWV